ncbi:MAG: sugar O-acetyltransferase [Blautia sp.]|nr:sugar O-acetyltransferase [Blautia sp.]
MTHKERMLRGLPYKGWLDGLTEDRELCRQKLYELNHILPGERAKIPSLLKSLFGKTGDTVWLEPPFYCDYGWNIEVGENFCANFGLTILDVGKVTMGDNVLIAPNVSIYTAGHPIHPDSRNSGYEYGIPVTIGNNVWIGGSAVILPGITIGDNAVVGAGSVVTKDIPDNMIVAGNPAKIIREITDDDRKYYFKDRVFDVEDY